MEQVKTSAIGQKSVVNGNQGLTPEEIMQRNRENFFRKRTMGTSEKQKYAVDNFTFVLG